MSDNKKIGFDILENSDMSTIDEIGTGKMKIDKNARDRMLNIAFREYETKKKKLGINQVFSYENSEMAESVSGVEVCGRKKFTHIIYIALCSAAVIALIVGSFSIFSRPKHITPLINNPIAEVTSTVSTTTVTITSTATSSVNNFVTSKVTVTEKGTTTINDTTSETSVITAVTEATTEQKQSDINVSYPYTNPHTDRTDITQKELEAAAVSAIKKLSLEKKNLPPVPDLEVNYRYSFYDFNADSVPELIVSQEHILGTQYMYVYDGREYVLAKFNGHDMDGNEKVHEVALDGIDAFTVKSIFGLHGHQGGSQSFILYMDSDNTITPLHEYTYYRYYEGGRLTDEYPSDDNLMMFKYFSDEYDLYEHAELNWTVYNDLVEEE